MISEPEYDKDGRCSLILTSLQTKGKVASCMVGWVRITLKVKYIERKGMNQDRSLVSKGSSIPGTSIMIVITESAITNLLFFQSPKQILNPAA